MRIQRQGFHKTSKNMTSTQTKKTLTLKAPAKLNLILEVLGKRPDGYHDILSWMIPISLYDELEFSSSDTFSFSGPKDLPLNEDNTVVKAWKLLEQHSGRKLPVNIRLQKKIPSGAGLGGGSSDAASTLKGLNEFFSLGLQKEDLMKIASQIGSDVPFFITCKSAICEGRGEKVTLIESVNSIFSIYFLVVFPHIFCSTKEMYANLNLSLTVNMVFYSFVPTIEAIKKINNIAILENIFFNRFEQSLNKSSLKLDETIRSVSLATKLKYHLTGSGSAFFCITDSAEKTQQLQEFIATTYGFSAFTCIAIA